MLSVSGATKKSQQKPDKTILAWTIAGELTAVVEVCCQHY